VRHTKALRLSWLGHVERRESERTPKCSLDFVEGEDLGRGGSKM
jgi:hypothetical protein